MRLVRVVGWWSWTLFWLVVAVVITANVVAGVSEERWADDGGWLFAVFFAALAGSVWVWLYQRRAGPPPASSGGRR